MNQPDLVARSFAAFSAEAGARPTITLRAGNELDDYRAPSPFHETLDAVSDSHLERYFWGVAFLDAASWRHYLPHLIEYALRHLRNGGNNVTDALLNSLRPPDREPPRLASLSRDQEAVVTAFLDLLAFSEGSAHSNLASQVLEEWWAPGALYRPVSE